MMEKHGNTLGADRRDLGLDRMNLRVDRRNLDVGHMNFGVNHKNLGVDHRNQGVYRKIPAVEDNYRDIDLPAGQNDLDYKKYLHAGCYYFP